MLSKIKHAVITMRAALVTSVSCLALASCAHAQTASAQPAPAAQQACDDATHRAFDFWIGEWQAYITNTDTLAGFSSIASADNGCVITEHWRSNGSPYTGQSLNIYNARAAQWEQFWVDSTGDITHFIGNATPDGMQLTAEDDVGPGAPTPIFSRITFTRNRDGTVRQHGEASTDRGATWTDRYDFTYRRTPSP